MKRLLHRLTDPAFLASEAKRLRTKYTRRLRRVDRAVGRMEPADSFQGDPRGDVLLSYIIDPFLLPAGHELPYSHTHFWECWTVGRMLAEQGFGVDAISWINHDFVPQKDYRAIIDVRLNLERLAPQLPNAVKVLHADTAHFTFHNPAQDARHHDLEQRRGVSIRAQKRLPANRAAEVADRITVLGNDFTRDTYAFADTPITRIPISVPFVYERTEHKDWEGARRRFLWFGSGGLVHKGLDLVLEAFASMPDFHLTVCGPIRQEADFEAAYFRELYQTPNIEPLGWVDVAPGGRFEAIARQVGALIYPTCSEGGGSSVLSCMHAGIVPIVPREASVDIADGETGILLGDCTVDSLRDAARTFAARPVQEVEAMARAAWRFAREHHTKDHFEAGYRRFAEQIAAEVDRRGA